MTLVATRFAEKQLERELVTILGQRAVDLEGAKAGGDAVDIEVCRLFHDDVADLLRGLQDGSLDLAAALSRATLSLLDIPSLADLESVAHAAILEA